MKFQMPLYKFRFALFLLAALAGTIGLADAKPVKKTVAGKSAPAQGPLYATRPDAMQFADDLASRRDLDANWVRDAIGNSRYIPTVSRLMQPSDKPFVKNWRVYRSRFIDPIRIEAGARFWLSNR